MNHFLAVDEEGYFLLENGIRLTDEKVGHDIFKNMSIDFEQYAQTTSTFGGTPVTIEAFDKPLVAQQVFKNKKKWAILLPYNWQEEFLLERLCLDEWDRFHGITDRGIPFVFSRKAQAEFFNLLDEFSDDTITDEGKVITIPPFYLEDKSADQIEFWDDLYKENPPWDLKGPHPAWGSILPQLKILKSRVINFGCGRGHDTAFFAEKGHVVTGVDVSPEAMNYANKNFAHLKNLKFIEADVFSVANQAYDLCIEHTLYCAIPPSKRKALIQKWYQNLDDGGHLLAIFFVMPWRKGPPYGSSEWELRNLLEKKFRLLYWKRWQHSPERRQGSELVVYAQKKDN